MYRITYTRYSLDEIVNQAEIMGVDIKEQDLPIIQNLLDSNGLLYLTPLLAGIRCLQSGSATERLNRFSKELSG